MPGGTSATGAKSGRTFQQSLAKAHRQSQPAPSSSSSSSSASTSYDPSAVPDAQAAVATAIEEESSWNPLSYVDSRMQPLVEQSILEQANSAETVIDAREELNQALRAQRAAAINVQDEPVKIKDEVDRMTRRDYRALTPLQKAAVDFNTNLVAAVRKDRRLADVYDPNKQQKETYANAIEEAFPSPGSGSKKYAPETLAVLRQIGYTDEQADFDDFLNLDAAVTTKDLKLLTPQDTVAPAKAVNRLGRGGAAGGGGNTYENPLVGERAGLSERLARGQQAAVAALDKGNKLLARYGDTLLAEDRETDVGLLGGAPSREATMVGYGNSELDTWFQQAFDTLANKESDPNIMFQIFQNERTPEERKAFMEYAESRIMAAVQKNTPIGETAGVAYRNPLQIAELLRIPGLKKLKPTPTEKPETETPTTAPAEGGGY